MARSKEQKSEASMYESYKAVQCLQHTERLFGLRDVSERNPSLDVVVVSLNLKISR
jgi:hypothetical protein